MKKFKLPRKLKKKLTKTVWFYPKENNGYLKANPEYDEEDFKAWKSGILIDFMKLLKEKK
jgi:hypothetical protein